MGLLDGDIAQLVSDALVGAGMSLPVTLTKIVHGVRNPGALTEGRTRTIMDYAAQGIVSTYSIYVTSSSAGAQIQVGDRSIKLWAASIESGAIPEPGDRISIADGTYTIVEAGVQRDAASAVYTCQCR